MKIILLLALCSFLGACSTSLGKRDPASTQAKEEAIHENYSGTFNN